MFKNLKITLDLYLSVAKENEISRDMKLLVKDVSHYPEEERKLSLKANE